ncbi:MAG: hypothetical protein ACD_28C00245G0003 [uncultured bacterium]|nr:MAG: hypothetical protein ACD_28C00245G0003 [uncultured bacterium]KKT75955.1 MAG: hypothetical protein UW70_C0025G0003 [Candidatus Peregrinibacteria bacterium GW2011_GWA2_44_7]
MFRFLILIPVLFLSFFTSFFELQGLRILSEAHYLAPEVVSSFTIAESSTPSSLPQKIPFTYEVEGIVDEATLAHCEDVIAKTFSVLPSTHVSAIHHLTLSFNSTIRRGLAGGHTMILRCVNITDSELVAVAVHELGHIVDTGYLQGSTEGEKTTFDDRGKLVYSDDPSFQFYSMSWEDSRSFTGSSTDVISGYSKELVFEEFAESYAAYILHGNLFRFYGARNEALNEKYRFLRDEVFKGKEYDLPERLPRILESEKRDYDITRRDFDLELFWSLSEAN